MDHYCIYCTNEEVCDEEDSSVDEIDDDVFLDSPNGNSSKPADKNQSAEVKEEEKIDMEKNVGEEEGKEGKDMVAGEDLGEKATEETVAREGCSGGAGVGDDGDNGTNSGGGGNQIDGNLKPRWLIGGDETEGETDDDDDYIINRLLKRTVMNLSGKFAPALTTDESEQEETDEISAVPEEKLREMVDAIPEREVDSSVPGKSKESSHHKSLYKRLVEASKNLSYYGKSIIPFNRLFKKGETRVD